MKRYINRLSIIVVLAVMAGCAEPADPSAIGRTYGDWYVVEYYVNGQAAEEYSSDGFIAFDRFTLERDGSFILEDVNGFVYVGTWTATSETLTLVEEGEGGTTFDFSIVYQTFQKIHLTQVISSPTAGDIELRYLMNKLSDGETY